MPRGAQRIACTILFLSAGLVLWHFTPPAPDDPGIIPDGPTIGRAPAATAAETTPVNGEAVVAYPESEAALDPVPGSAEVAFHEFSVDTPLIAVAHAGGDPADLPTFRVRLGPDRFADVDVARFDALNDEEGVYSGAIRGHPDSQAVFSYVGLAHAGTVVLPDEERAFYITATEEGLMRVTEVDLTRAPLCAPPLVAQGGISVPETVLP